MKNKLLRYFLILTFTIALTACGGGDSGSTAATGTGGGLNCGTNSGFDESANGGQGAPVTPHSFTDYETVLSDCGTVNFDYNMFAGKTFTYDSAPGETLTFDTATTAPTASLPGDATFTNGSITDNLTWYVETVNGNSLLVLNYGPDFRDTSAVTGISSPNGIDNPVYSLKGYYEQSNYAAESPMVRETGTDGEIWAESISLSLSCETDSGFDETLDGGLGRPITPYSFVDYNVVVAKCMSITLLENTIDYTSFSGNTFTSLDLTESTSFAVATSEPTAEAPGSGEFDFNGEIIPFTWYTKIVNDQVYVVMDAVHGDIEFRETWAIFNIQDTTYSLKVFTEQSNYAAESPMVQEQGFDGEIWGNTVNLQLM